MGKYLDLEAESTVRAVQKKTILVMVLLGLEKPSRLLVVKMKILEDLRLNAIG